MQFNPFLKYSYKLNGERIVGISLGPNITEKAEESFDEGGFNLPINVRGIEYEMNGTLEIEIKDSRNNVRSFTYLIIFDEVHKTSVYGWFTHSLRVVEYTNKLNGYFVDTLIKTFSNQRTNNPARRRIPRNGYLRTEYTTNDRAYRVIMPYLDIRETIYTNNGSFTINGNVGQVDYIHIPEFSSTDITIEQANAFVMIDNDPLTKQNISFGNATFTNIEQGEHTIQYGLMNVPDLLDDNISQPYPLKDIVIYEFNVLMFENTQITLYDVINKLRNIKPFETSFYHLRTRLFNIDDTVVVNGYTLKEILQKTPAPQFFIQKATMFQVLSGIFKYINSIPRLLRNGNYIDNLSRDDFNNVVGTFSTSGMYDYTSSQDIQLYGTRGISPLERTLPNNLDKPNIETPANNFFKTIRATNVQLTMNNNEWYIPLEKNIYMITKFEVIVPSEIRLYQTWQTAYNEGPSILKETINNLKLDITPRVIDKRLWDLKDNQNLFPSIDYLKSFDEYVGARNNKSGNIYWEQGENGIRIANYMGELIKKELLINVIKEAIEDYVSYEHRNSFSLTPFGTDALPRIIQETVIDAIDVKTLKFNIEYVTLQDFNVSQEREDRSIINRFSEIALKQSDKQINVELASRKSYGELQRGALPNYSFSMVHNYLDEIIDLFTVDNEGYTIVERSMTFYNTYIDVVYVATKDHNRLQDFIGVNQEYRAWEIPTSNKIYDRKETYVDYVFIVPSNEDINYTITKNLMTSKFYRQLVSNLQNDKTYSKITFGLVYTDGFGREYGSIEPNNNFKLLIVPTIVVGTKQSLVFSLGFNDNQLAGNSLEKEGDLTYNKAVRYTDFKGELNEFWMALFSNIEDLEDILDTETYNYDDYPLTPEIEKNSAVISSMLDNSVMNNGTIMTTTPSLVHGEYNPFIVDKDSHENITIQYNVSVMSFNYGQFVVGQRFTSFNPLVNNDLDDLYIYVYDNQNYTKYGIFNDQTIRNMGNATKVLLSASNVAISDINNGQNRYGVRVEFIGTLKTLVESNSNWVIGDNEGNLYLACNENISSFDFLGTHTDVRVREIGKDIKAHIIGRYYVSIRLLDTVVSETITPIDYNDNLMLTTEVDYDYSYTLLTTVYISLSDTVVSETITPQQVNDVASLFIAYSGEERLTVAPTVGTPYCKKDGAINSYRVLITNNENMSVTIRNGNTVLGTMTALETSKEFIFDSGSPTPYNYNINITAQASGLKRSTNVNRSGTIILCTL